MSFSQEENKTKNPAKKFIEFNGKEGKFSYYDKEKQENVEVKLPLKFIVLDQLSTVRGYDDASQSGIYANEVKYMNTELHVRAFKGGTIIKGLYKDIKDSLKANGIKYVKSVYCLIDGEICNIALKGASFSAWLSDTEKMPIQQFSFEVNKLEEGKKGAIKYYMPKFEAKPITEKEYNLAMEKDKELQAYLSQYLKSEEKDEEVNNAPDVPSVNYESEIKPEDLPF